MLPKLNDADLRLLRLFATIVEAGGFTAAQTQLNISQSRISGMMADLEARLGMRLCQRGRVGFRLTDKGRVVYEASRRLFANCVWDGLSIIALLGGTGRLDTHSPATGEPLVFAVVNGRVTGEGIAHFLVPAACFWDDIGFT